MPQLRRFLYAIAALVCIVGAVLLLWRIGLPDRSEFTGQINSEIGFVAPEAGALAPPFRMTALDGETIDLLMLRGHIVILNFWATWCEPCIIEMPILQTIHDDYYDAGVRVIGVNLGEDEMTIREWLEANGFTFAILPDETTSLATTYRLRGQPSTFVISPEGAITHIFYGPVQESTLHDIITGGIQ